MTSTLRSPCPPRPARGAPLRQIPPDYLVAQGQASAAHPDDNGVRRDCSYVSSFPSGTLPAVTFTAWARTGSKVGCDIQCQDMDHSQSPCRGLVDGAVTVLDWFHALELSVPPWEASPGCNERAYATGLIANATPLPAHLLVGRTRLELVTSCVSCKRATRLRQRPSRQRGYHPVALEAERLAVSRTGGESAVSAIRVRLPECRPPVRRHVRRLVKVSHRSSVFWRCWG